MIVREYVTCGECGTVHVLRIGLGAEPVQAHQFACTSCEQEMSIRLELGVGWSYGPNTGKSEEDIVVGFASHATGCAGAELCSAQVADTMLQQGQGMHGSFSRADTHNFMAAIGPDFRKRMIAPAPVSNADVGVTAAYLLGLSTRPRGALEGHLITEALAGVSAPRNLVRANPAANGFATVLKIQSDGQTEYFDAARIPGRTVGLEAVQSECPHGTMMIIRSSG